MDIEITEEDKRDQKLCQICNEKFPKYSCPRCGIEYCSVDCYKSESHSDCSESFYKECVEAELQLDEKDPESRRKMMEILKRMHDEQEEDISELDQLAQEDLDSDDDEDVPDLSERLQNVDLDNADSVWAALTDTEKQEFEALLQNGEVEKLIPVWEPWWSYRAETKLIEDLSQSKPPFDYKNNCPKLKQIRPYDEISKTAPAECVKYNLLNVLHAYAFTVIYFNGDHHDFVRESSSILLEMSNNLRENEIFADAHLATASVFQQATNSRSVITDAENMLAVKTAGASILEGPEGSNSCYYVLAALSDIHDLFSKAKTLNKTSGRSENINVEFSKRFPNHSVTGTALHKDKLRLCLKKIEYYLSWVDSYGKCLCTRSLN